MRGTPPVRKLPRRSLADAIRALQAGVPGALEPPALYTALVAAVATSLGDPPVALFLAGAQGGDYLWQAGTGLAADLGTGTRVRRADLPPAWAAPAAAPAAPVRVRRRITGLADFRPVVAMPLAGAGPPGGFLLLGPRPDARPYTAADLALLDALAGLIADRLRAAALTGQYQRSLLQLQTLHRLGEELSANLDIEAVCQTVYEQLRGALDFDSCFVAQYDETLGMLTFPFGIDEGVRYYLAPAPLGAGLASWIFANGRPLVLEDLSQGVEHLNMPFHPDRFGSERRSRAWMGVPMMAKHRTIGVLSVQSYTAGIYNEAQVQFLSTVANQVASALENARLFAERERRIAELSTLNEISRRLSGTLRVSDVIDNVYDQLNRVFDAEHFCLALVDPVTSNIRYNFIGDSHDGEDPNIPAIRGTVAWLIRHAVSLHVARQLLSRLATLGIDAPGLEARSLLGVPLQVGATVIGAMVVYNCDREGAYDQDHLHLFTTIAAQVAVVIQNARLYERTDIALTRRVAELSALEEIARQLNASLDLGGIINLVVARAVEMTGATAGILALFDAATQTLRLLGQIGYPPEVIDRYTQHPLPISKGVIGRAVREDRTLLVRDVHHDPDYITVTPDIRSQLVVLVRRGGQVLGALSLESQDPDGFHTEHVEFIEHLAEHSAIAVENARRYERERRQNEALTRRAGELAAILRIGNVLKADLSLDEVLTQVAEGVRSSLGFNVAILSLIDEGPPRRFIRVAAAGLDAETWARLKTAMPPAEESNKLLDPRFQISESYFISHLYNPVTHLETYFRPDITPRDETEWHPDDMLLVPLRGKGGQLVGVLSVDDPVDRQLPSRATIETLEIFANQAAVAIENARLFEAQRRRLRELALLQESGVGLSATLDPTELLAAVVRSAVQLFEVRASAITLVPDPSNPRMSTASLFCEARDGGLEVRPYSAVDQPELTQEIILGGDPVVVPDATADPRLSPDLVARGLRSLAGVPLRVGNQAQGVLYLFGDRAHPLDSQEQQLLRIFANQAAVAVQNARLFEEETRRLQDVTSLQDLGLRFTATLDIRTLLEEVVRAANHLLDTNSSGVLLVDETGTQAVNVRCWVREGGQVETRSFNRAIRRDGLTNTVMRTGRPIMLAETLGDPRINPAMIAEGIRSFVMVPIRIAEQTLGTLFVNSYQPRAFSAHEQQLLQVFANQVAVAIKNALLFEERRDFEQRLIGENERMARELVTARATQRQLLPELPRRVAGLTMHGICLPAMEVGGDYYDLVPLPDGRLALALGDVTGKGTAAVMLMAMVKTALLSQVSTDPQPHPVLQTLNTLAVDLMQGQLMTFFYALYDPATRVLTYSNAGHLYPYIRRADGSLDYIAGGGLPLGALPTVAPKVFTLQVAPGDLLVFFSDGIVEAADSGGEMFSFERVEETLRQVPPGADLRLLVEDIVDRVHAFAGGAPQDDVTLLIARVDDGESAAGPPGS
jgi:GAF domain-containing protein